MSRRAIPHSAKWLPMAQRQYDTESIPDHFALTLPMDCHRLGPTDVGSPAMTEIVAYSVTPTGQLWVRLANGCQRAATDREWLALWQTDPRLTLRLVH